MSEPPGASTGWRRPVPLIGDTTAASQRAADPAGWSLGPAVRAALGEVLAARRDIRRYRSDPVPDELMMRVLAAGHQAPSVGHSQPWRFLVVTEAQLRDRAAAMADRERLRQAELLEPDAAGRLLDLQLEGIREAPLGVVVCCDRRAPAAGVLGRATFADADVWSCACAIENMWLAARAEGLGMGWVTLFEPSELAELLGLPDGVVSLGWLCLGWPDERPPEPGLVRAGWSQRLPLEQVVLRERWPAAPAAPPAPVSRLRGPDQAAVVAAHDDADRLLTPPGSLGLLDRAVDQVLALGHPDPASGALLLVGADHPVAALGVSAYPPAVTAQVLRAAVGGDALGVALARGVGLEVTVVDAGASGPAVSGALDRRARGPRGDLADTPALAETEAVRLVEAGRALGERIAERHGLVALGEVGVANTTVAAALACRLLGAAPEQMVGLGAGADSAMLARKQAVVRRALARTAGAATGPAGGPIGGADDPMRALAELGGPELAVLAGAMLGAAAGGAAVVLDGLAVGAAALVAVRLEPGLHRHLLAGQRSRERGHGLVLRELGCEPLLDLRLRAGEGAGASLAVNLLAVALRARRHTARVAY